MQALEDAIATSKVDFLHDSPLCSIGSNGGRFLVAGLDAPQPSQHIRGEHGDSGSSGDAG
jgi:hypothetical protein